ncbi:hypothetical protein MCERE10_02408 [Burkholderiaceae bacterium]
MSLPSKIIEKTHTYLKKIFVFLKVVDRFVGMRLLCLPILQEKFELFNSKELSEKSKSDILELVSSIEKYLEQDINASYDFPSRDDTQEFLRPLKLGLENNLFAEGVDQDILEKIPALTDAYDTLISFANLRTTYHTNLPSVLKKYQKTIGPALANAKPEIINPFVTPDKRIAAFSDAITGQLIDLFGVEDSTSNRLFLLEVIFREGYGEGLWELTLCAVPDFEYESKLRSMWPDFTSFIANSEYDEYAASGTSSFPWEPQLACQYDVLYRLDMRSEAILLAPEIQRFRQKNSGPLRWHGYLVAGLSILLIRVPAVFWLGLVFWYGVRYSIQRKRRKFTCQNCTEIFTIAVADSDFISSQESIVRVATQSKVTDTDGKHFATIHGEKDITKSTALHEEHRCCLSCGVIFTEDVYTIYTTNS